MVRSIVTLGLVVGAAVGPAGAALGQDDTSTMDTLLGGPSVTVEADRPSLVEHDYEGELRPLEVRPEIAAIGLLGLTEAEREAVDALIDARAALVDQVVTKNMDLFTELRAARESAGEGQRQDQDATKSRRDTASRFREALAPLLEQEPLAEHYAEALPGEKRDEYLALINEWRDATAKAAAGDPMGGEVAERRPRGPQQSPAMAGVRMEIRAAVERGRDERRDRSAELVKRLDLSPEQESTFRGMLREAGDANDGKPTQAQRREIMQKFLATLPEDQRRRAMEALRERRSP